MAALGMAAPAFIAIGVIATQALGSVLLLIDRAAWIGGGLLAGFTLLATVLAHGFRRDPGVAYTGESTTCLEHLAIVGGLILASLPYRRLAASA